MSSNMEKIRMSSMGSTTSLFRCSKKMDSYCRNKAKVLVRLKDMKVYSSETPQVETPTR
jgi:hypothetical protein